MIGEFQPQNDHYSKIADAEVPERVPASAPPLEYKESVQISLIAHI